MGHISLAHWVIPVHTTKLLALLLRLERYNKQTCIGFFFVWLGLQNMSHQKFKPKLTGDDTEEIASYRRVLGADIGSLEHPYFSTSVRKYDQKFGKKASMPKFAALMKKNEWRADSSLQAYKRRHERRKTANIPGHLLGKDGKNLKKMIAKNETQSQDNANSNKNGSDHDGKSASGNNGAKNAPMGKNANKKKPKKNDVNNRKNNSSSSNDGNKDGNQKKNNNLDAFATLDAKAKKQIAEKRKVAKAWYKMACSTRVRSAIVKDGAVKAMVTAHIRVDLPELRGSLPKMPDLQHIAVQMEEPVLCSMQWHMTSVETSVKPPAPPELPNLKIKPVESENEEASSGATAIKDNEIDDDNEEETGGANDSLGMSRVIDITRKHIGKYCRLPRSAESKEKLKKMRLLEKPKAVIIETKGLPSKPAIDSPPPSTITNTEDQGTRANKRNSMLPPLSNGERTKQREEKLLHGFANRSISMPNISSFPGNSGFASNLMINNNKSIEEEIQYTRPRIITPGAPIEAPMDQPLSVQFRDTGSFLSHLDDVLGYNVGNRSSTSSSFNRSADNLIHEEASHLSMSTSKLSGIDNSNTISLTDTIDVKKKIKQPVMAGKTLLGNSVKIGTKNKQRKAKMCNKHEWPFVTSHE
eukprot:g1853.t1